MKTALVRQSTSTLKTVLWIVIFIGSVSMVSVIRRQLSANQPLTHVARAVSAQVIHTAYQTSGLGLPH